MGWRYRKFRSYSRKYQPKFFYSEKEIDFTTESIDYSQFLLQEFFTADLETRRKLSDYYIQEYGKLSFIYLNRKYSEWVNGDYHLTDMMKERITSFMPNFLNEQAKHNLGLHEFMASIKNTVKAFQKQQQATYSNLLNLKSPQEVFSIFEREYDKIQVLTIPNFKFNVLTEDEKEEALEISRYILEIKLQKAFEHIQRDLNIFLKYTDKFKRGIFSASYSTKQLNIKVDMTNKLVYNFENLTFTNNESEANSRFKEYSDKYLAYELVSLYKESNKAYSHSFLNENDIQLFLDHFLELSNGENEVSMNSTFEGEGGILLIKANIKPLKLLKTLMLKSYINLVIYFILIAIFVLYVVNNINFNLLIFGSLIGGILAYSLVSEEIEKLKLLTKEYKTYGK